MGSHPIDCLQGFFIIFLVARARTWVQFCLFPLKWPLCYTDRDKTNLISSVLTQKRCIQKRQEFKLCSISRNFKSFVPNGSAAAAVALKRLIRFVPQETSLVLKLLLASLHPQPFEALLGWKDGFVSTLTYLNYFQAQTFFFIYIAALQTLKPNWKTLPLAAQYLCLKMLK